MDKYSYYTDPKTWEFLADTSQGMSNDIKELIPSDVNLILDAGCGNGAVSNQFADSWEIVGCDISESALKSVKYNRAAANLFQLPFASDTFDLVLSTDVIEHIPENLYKQVCDELLRVSKRYLLIAVPFCELLDYATVSCHHCGANYHVHWHQRNYSLETILSLWEGKAAAKEYRYAGSRWPWTNQELLTLRKELLGRHYPYSRAVCESCEKSNEALPLNQAAGQLQRELESLHYLHAESGHIGWPCESEIIVLFDKKAEKSKAAIPPIAAVPHTPARLDFSQLPISAVTPAYPVEYYIVTVQTDSFVLVLPQLPEQIAISPIDTTQAFVELYDYITQRYYPIRGTACENGKWVFELFRVAPSEKGYFLRIINNLHSLKSIEFNGSLCTKLSNKLDISSLYDFRFSHIKNLQDYFNLELSRSKNEFYKFYTDSNNVLNQLSFRLTDVESNYQTNSDSATQTQEFSEKLTAFEATIQAEMFSQREKLRQTVETFNNANYQGQIAQQAEQLQNIMAELNKIKHFQQEKSHLHAEHLQNFSEKIDFLDMQYQKRLSEYREQLQHTIKQLEKEDVISQQRTHFQGEQLSQLTQKFENLFVEYQSRVAQQREQLQQIVKQLDKVEAVSEKRSDLQSEQLSDLTQKHKHLLSEFQTQIPQQRDQLQQTMQRLAAEAFAYQKKTSFQDEQLNQLGQKIEHVSEELLQQFEQRIQALHTGYQEQLQAQDNLLKNRISQLESGFQKLNTRLFYQAKNKVRNLFVKEKKESK